MLTVLLSPFILMLTIMSSEAWIRSASERETLDRRRKEANFIERVSVDFNIYKILKIGGL